MPSLRPKNVEKKSRAPKGISLLVQRYGRERIEQALARANEKLDNGYVAHKNGPSGDDFYSDKRLLGKFLSSLKHDTPERDAFLTANGFDPKAFPVDLCAQLGSITLKIVDEYQGEWLHKPYTIIGSDEERLPGLMTRRLSDVRSQEVEWLWPQRIPLGKLTIISGDPGLGKTWVVLDVIARITSGRDFPDAPNPFAERRDALWISGEDDDADTVCPRLDALGADRSRVHSLCCVVEPENRAECTLNLRKHVDLLDVFLTDHPLVAVVVIDPLASFLGKLDSHKNADVRALLTPLSKLAAKHRVALVGINHFTKGDGESAMYRSMGSIAFVAAARSSWMLSRDPKEPEDRRLFLPIKNNLASQDVGGLAFRVGGRHAERGGFLWEEGRIDTTADDVLRAANTRAPALEQAKAWLRAFLKEGAKPAASVEEQANTEGLCWRTVETAAKALGVLKKKSGGKGSPWTWALPEPAND